MNRFYPNVRSILVVAYNKAIAEDVNLKLRDPSRRDKLPRPTPYNVAINQSIMARAEHVVVSALAGTGKTTQIEHGCNLFPNVTPMVSTIHGVGAKALNYHFRNNGRPVPELDEFKVDAIVAAIMGIDAMEEGAAKDRAVFIKGVAVNLVSLMKAHAFLAVRGEATDADLDDIMEHYGIELFENPADRERAFNVAREALQQNNRNVHTIDFDDQVYLPLVLNVSFYQNDLIFVDECQDLNPARIYLIKRLAGSRGQVVFVGDRNQAIYGFTGADTEAMDKIIEMFRAVELPLSTCWRCPIAVLDEARKIVPAIENAPGAIQGSVSHLESHDDMYAKVKAGDFILCRTTAPLVASCMSLIRRGIAATIRGRDIAKGLIGLTNKIAKRRNIKGKDLTEALQLYKEDALSRLEDPRKAKQREAMADKMDTLIVLAEEANDWAGLRDRINSIFSDSKGAKNLVLLSTAHGAKGLETKNVFIIHPELMPFPFARKDWEKVQEVNLKYVAITRATENLYWVEDGSTQDREKMSGPAATEKKTTRGRKKAQATA